MRQLHADLLDRWNRRDAAGFAALFAPEGNVVGFDGSQIDGAGAIEAHLRPEAASALTAELQRHWEAMRSGTAGPTS